MKFSGFTGFLIVFIIIGLSVLPTSAQNLQKNTNMTTYDTATFGSGCYWCSQAIFERVKGVISSTAGYSGGKGSDPTYEEVSRGKSGYAEGVQVVYDPEQINFKSLLEIFWKMHDPTTLNRQGADVGTQYRSAIFYHNEAQKLSAQQYKEKLRKAKIWDDPIVTEISLFKTFYPAEKYHQDYYKKNPAAAYCQFVITPKIEKFEKLFSDQLKK